MELKTFKNVQQFTQLNAEEQINFINNKIKSYQNESKLLADSIFEEYKDTPTPKNIHLIVEKQLDKGLNTLLEELGELALSHAKKVDSFDKIEVFLAPLMLAFEDLHKNADTYDKDELIISPLFSKLLESPYRKLFTAFYQPKFYDSLIQYLSKNFKYNNIKDTLFFSILSTCLLFQKGGSKQIEMTSLDFENFTRYLPQFDFEKSTDGEILSIFKHIKMFLSNCYFTRNNLVDLCKLMQKRVILSPKELSRIDVDSIGNKMDFSCLFQFENVLENIVFEKELTQEETNALSNLLFNENMKAFILHIYFNHKTTRLPLILSNLNYIVPDYFFYEKDEDVEINNPNVSLKSLLIRIANNYYQHNNSHSFQLNLFAEKMFKDEMSFIEFATMFKTPFYHFPEEIFSVKELMSLDHSKSLLNVFNANTLSAFYLPIIDSIQKEINAKTFFNKLNALLNKQKNENYITLILKHLFFRNNWNGNHISKKTKFQIALLFYSGLKITVDKINKKQFDDSFIMTNTQNERKIVDFFNHLNGILTHFEKFKDTSRKDLDEDTKFVVQEENKHKILERVNNFIRNFN